MKKILFAFILTLLISSCKDKEYCEIITGKRYIPCHNEISTMIVGEAVIPTVRYEPDEWLLFTENHRRSVPEFIYDFAEVGDTLFVTKRCTRVEKAAENY